MRSTGVHKVFFVSPGKGDRLAEIDVLVLFGDDQWFLDEGHPEGCIDLIDTVFQAEFVENQCPALSGVPSRPVGPIVSRFVTAFVVPTDQLQLEGSTEG